MEFPQLVSAMCLGAESEHAGVQLAAVKAVLTAATSDYLRLHGNALLEVRGHSPLSLLCCDPASPSVATTLVVLQEST
eukprot:4130304-Pyramimonas_sp.AAC.1